MDSKLILIGKQSRRKNKVGKVVVNKPAGIQNKQIIRNN
jgi:hypothetical protein